MWITAEVGVTSRSLLVVVERGGGGAKGPQIVQQRRDGASVCVRQNVFVFPLLQQPESVDQGLAEMLLREISR